MGSSAYYLLHFRPRHSSAPSAEQSGGRKRAPPVSWCSALRVPVSGPQCPSTVRWKVEQALRSPNGIINSLSKEITPSRVKGGELWREHVLMSFMTLQIMHYRQERSWEAPSHNCIDFSLMATNNDIFFLHPGEGQEWLVPPKGVGQAHARTHSRELIHSLGNAFLKHSDAFLPSLLQSSYRPPTPPSPPPTQAQAHT